LLSHQWPAVIKVVLTRQIANLLLLTECLRSSQCAPAKHHYDECAERVTKQQEENGKADEDCVEECKFCLREMKQIFVKADHTFQSST
jgi:hypothetical protein